MSAIEGVSEIFDPDAWDAGPRLRGPDRPDLPPGRAHGTVRIAFDRPDVLNAFRPHTVDELLRVLEHARTTQRRRLRAAHRQRPQRQERQVGVLHRRRPADPRPDRLPVRRGRDRREHRRQGQARPAAHPRVPAADPVHAQDRRLRGQRLGGRRWPLAARGLRPHPRQRRARPVQADRRRRRLVRRRLRVGVPRPPGRPEVRPRDLLPRRGVLRRGRPPDGHGQQGGAARRARGGGARVGRARSTARARPRSGC